MSHTSTALLALCALASLANAHAILTSPLARAGSNGPDNIGVKISSPQDAQFFNTCGNAATRPGPPSATLTQGRPFTVAWDITIDHVSDPGVSVAFRCGGQGGFTQLVSGVTAQDAQVDITMPRAASGACEVQWIWTSLEDGGSYIACADVQVNAAGGADAQQGQAPPPPPPNAGAGGNQGGNNNGQVGGNNGGGGGGGGGGGNQQAPANGIEGGFLGGGFFSNINLAAANQDAGSQDAGNQDSAEEEEEDEE